MFDRIKRFYDEELWSLERVKNVVGIAINEEEFKLITGLKYDEVVKSEDWSWKAWVKKSIQLS